MQDPSPVLDAVEDPLVLRTLFAAFPTGVAALAAMVDGSREILIASTFQVGISLNPPMVSFAVQNASSTWPMLREVSRIGVSVLAAGHSKQVRQLASKVKADRLTDVATVDFASGAIFLEDASVWLECEMTHDYEAGDHRIIVLTVTGAISHDRDPLVFHGSAFRGLTPLSRQQVSQ